MSRKSSSAIFELQSVSRKTSKRIAYLYEMEDPTPNVGVLPIVLLHSLNEMRSQKELCDVILCAGEGKFPAHKAVLAAVSPFFRTIFTCDFAEAKEKELEIQEADATTLSAILDFIYTAKLKETADMILVLELAEFLQIACLKCICCEYLKHQINHLNCERIYKTAETLQLQELQETTKRFMYHHGIGELGLQAQEYKSKKQFCHKIVLIAGGCDWAGESQRSAECLTKLYGTLRWRHTRPPHGDVEKPSDTLAVMRDARIGPAYVASSTHLYVFGGKQNAGYYLSTVERFNLSDNTWQQLSPMPVKLRGAAATIVNGRIWLIGGTTNQDWDQRVWIYNIEADSWHQGPSLPEKRIYHSAISWHNSIYVVGGRTEGDMAASNSVLMLQSGGSEWMEVAPMQKARSNFGCTLAHGCIYVIGGVDGIHTLYDSERYNLIRNQWRTIADYSIPVEGCRAATLINKSGDETVLCIGGHDGLEGINRVERLGVTLNEWHCVPELNTPRSHFALAVFPKYT